MKRGVISAEKKRGQNLALVCWLVQLQNGKNYFLSSGLAAAQLAQRGPKIVKIVDPSDGYPEGGFKIRVNIDQIEKIELIFYLFE